jgi:hypothetical protein
MNLGLVMILVCYFKLSYKAVMWSYQTEIDLPVYYTYFIRIPFVLNHDSRSFPKFSCGLPESQLLCHCFFTHRVHFYILYLQFFILHPVFSIFLHSIRRVKVPFICREPFPLCSDFYIFPAHEN